MSIEILPRKERFGDVMNMTHPDIDFVERHGYTREQMNFLKRAVGLKRTVGVCKECGCVIPEGDAYIKSADGVFCNIDCCHDYYEIEEYCD